MDGILFRILLKTTAIITSLPICGFILFLVTLRTEATLRTYYYFTSTLNGTAKGIITSSEVLRGTGGKYKGDYHVITYTYDVQGKQYSSDLFNFKERSFGNSHEITRRYPAGKEVLVWYDKDSPEVGVLEKSGPTPGIILIAALNILFSCLGFLLNPLIWIAFGDKYRKNRYQQENLK